MAISLLRNSSRRTACASSKNRGHREVVYVGVALAEGVAPSAYAENARLSAGAHDVVLDGLSFHYVIAGHGPLLVVQAPGWGIGSTYLRKGLTH